MASWRPAEGVGGGQGRPPRLKLFAGLPQGEELADWWSYGDSGRVVERLRGMWEALPAAGPLAERIAFALAWALLIDPEGEAGAAAAIAGRYRCRRGGSAHGPAADGEPGAVEDGVPYGAWLRLHAYALTAGGDHLAAGALLLARPEGLPIVTWLEDWITLLLASDPDRRLAALGKRVEVLVRDRLRDQQRVPNALLVAHGSLSGLLGDVWAALGELPLAVDAWEQAVISYSALGDPGASAFAACTRHAPICRIWAALESLAQEACRRGRKGKAIALCRRALRLGTDPALRQLLEAVEGGGSPPPARLQVQRHACGRRWNLHHRLAADPWGGVVRGEEVEARSA